MTEPMCWWTEMDKELFRQTLVITERDGWVDYYSPPHGNIYGEGFAWSERVK